MWTSDIVGRVECICICICVCVCVCVCVWEWHGGGKKGGEVEWKEKIGWHPLYSFKKYLFSINCEPGIILFAQGTALI